MDNDTEHKKKLKEPKSVQKKEDLCLKATKIAYLMIKSFCNRNKDLKVTTIMFTLDK